MTELRLPLIQSGKRANCKLDGPRLYSEAFQNNDAPFTIGNMLIFYGDAMSLKRRLANFAQEMA